MVVARVALERYEEQRVPVGDERVAAAPGQMLGGQFARGRVGVHEGEVVGEGEEVAVVGAEGDEAAGEGGDYLGDEVEVDGEVGGWLELKVKGRF